MKTVYLAARFSRQEELRGYKAELLARGIGVTSRWLGDGHKLTDEELADEQLIVMAKRARFATEDLTDLIAADTIINFTEDPHSPLHGASRGGRHVEFGVALATDKRVVVIGPRENVFHCLANLEVFATWAAFIASEFPEGER